MLEQPPSATQIKRNKTQLESNAGSSYLLDASEIKEKVRAGGNIGGSNTHQTLNTGKKRRHRSRQQKGNSAYDDIDDPYFQLSAASAEELEADID